VAVTCVAELTAKAAAVAPKCTAVAPVKPVPVIVTEVPPAGGPVLGAIPVTAGGGPAAAAGGTGLSAETVMNVMESRARMLAAAFLLLMEGLGRRRGATLSSGSLHP
jgi:hypothetical protein